MTKTTGQRIVDEWRSYHGYMDPLKGLPDLSRRIDQALETANAEVERLRERLEVILAHPEGVTYSSDFWKAFAREALAKKETP